jgi:hypothetical protein
MTIVISCKGSKNFIFELYHNSQLKGYTNCFDYAMFYTAKSSDHNFKVSLPRYLTDISFLFE